MIDFLVHRDRTLRRSSLAALVIAFAIASFLFKFGSFALECLAFFGTWLALDAIFTAIGSLAGKRSRDDIEAF